MPSDFPTPEQRWTVEHWGSGRVAVLENDDKVHDDVALEVTGNLTQETKLLYAKAICERLNSLARSIQMEGVVELSREDGGMALIAESINHGLGDDGMFVRLQSWDSSKEHILLKSLEGNLVRITVEVIPG